MSSGDPYTECPQCGDDVAILRREADTDDVYECRSCKTPLGRSWLDGDTWTLAEDYDGVHQ